MSPISRALEALVEAERQVELARELTRQVDRDEYQRVKIGQRTRAVRRGVRSLAQAVAELSDAEGPRIHAAKYRANPLDAAPSLADGR